MIQFNSLTFTYSGTRDPALREITFGIPSGQFVSVIGANKAGKSSLCFAIAGFIPNFFPGCYQGKVTVDGQEVSTTPLNQLSQTIGFVMQNPRNQISGAKTTVAEEVAFGLENLGIERAQMHTRVAQTLEQVGISGLADRSPMALSGGEQQKVVIASILVMQPRLLVLDEPTAQLDPTSGIEIFRLLKNLTKEGVTVFIAEHRMDEIAEYSERVIAIADHRILLDGKPDEVFTSPLLVEHGIGIPHMTGLALRAREKNLWLRNRPLPTRLEEAIDSFRGNINGS